MSRAATRSQFTLPHPSPAEPKGEAIRLHIVFEDDSLIVIDKPAGLVVHPAPGHAGGALVERPDRPLRRRPVRHRRGQASGHGAPLNKDTSGLMVVAKDDRARRKLSASSPITGAPTTWSAAIWRWCGAASPAHGTMSTPIDRHPHARDKMAVREGGREAVTHYEVLGGGSIKASRSPARSGRAGNRAHPPDPGPHRP